jgi:hypothetical protein
MTSPLINTVHRVAAWGEPDADEHVQLWNTHLDDLNADSPNISRVETATIILRAVATHLWLRLTGPRSTALPAALTLGFAAFGPWVMWQTMLLPEIPEPLWLAMSIALAASAAVLAASPTRLRPRAFAAAATAVGISGLTAIGFLDVMTTTDRIVFAGWILVALGSFGTSVAAVTVHPRNRVIFDRAVWVMAAGAFLLGIGHTAWASEGALIYSGIFSLITGSTATAGLLSLRSLH